MDTDFWGTVTRIPGAGGTDRFVWLYYGLVRALRPRLVVESGVYHGYSTCFIAAACQEEGAQLIAIDDFAEGSTPEEVAGYLDACGVAQGVTLVRGEAIETLRRLEAEGHLEGLGLAFLDDDHHADHVYAELTLLWPHLVDGGIIVSHDAQTLAWPDLSQAFLRLEQETGARAVWIRGNNGVCFIQKIAGPPRQYPTDWPGRVGDEP